jgi:GDP-L-fucose synthase
MIMYMEKSAKILVAGYTGLVGSAITRQLQLQGYDNLLLRDYRDVDFTNQKQTLDFFEQNKPEFVFLAAAKVGGIVANSTYPAQFYYENIMIQSNIIHGSYLNKVKRLLFLGSSCIYPKLAPQPMKEEHLLTGALELTNRPYALAKIGGIEQCWSYNRQYSTHYIAAMPTNLYGPGDNYNLQSSHVLPAMIRKMHEAKERHDKTVTLWGTGSPYRELLCNLDLAAACVYLLNMEEATYNAFVGSSEQPPLVNIGYGQDFTIKELAAKVAAVVGFNGQIVWDSSKPDGTPRKLMDSSRIFALGWKPTVKLDDGIRLAYQDFLARRDTLKD